MEQIQETISVPAQVHVAAFWQSLYLRFVLILTLGFTFTSIGVTIFVQAIPPVLPPSNPFLEYTNLFLGQPISAMEEKGFSCWNSHNYGYSDEPICRFALSGGIFSNIDLFISDGVIHQITFILRDDALQAGDLILLFGKPNFRVYPHKVFFFWNNLFVIVSTTDRGNSTPMRPVWSVTFAYT